MCMKLLLSSAGITNKSIFDALISLVGKNPKTAFILTAKNNREIPAEVAMVNQTRQLDIWGLKYICVDPSHDKNWKTLLEDRDLIIIGGGNTFNLLNESRKTGFDKWIKNNIDTKVFFGTSAGSILFTPSIAIASVDDGDENTPGITDLRGLNVIDFELSPHTPEDVSIKGNLEYSKHTKNMILMYDNQSSVMIQGNQLSIISEGKWAWCQDGKQIKVKEPNLTRDKST